MKSIFILLLCISTMLTQEIEKKIDFKDFEKRLYRLQGFVSERSNPIKGNALLLGTYKENDKICGYFITCYHILQDTEFFQLRPSYNFNLCATYTNTQIKIQSYRFYDLAFFKIEMYPDWICDVEEIDFGNKQTMKPFFPRLAAQAIGYDQQQTGQYIVLDVYINDVKEYYQLRDVLKPIEKKEQKMYFYKIIENRFTAGMSGSPIFTHDGKLVGIVSFKYDEKTYLISADNIQELWEPMKNKSFHYNQVVQDKTIFYEIMLKYLRNDNPKYMIQYKIRKENKIIISDKQDIDLREIDNIPLHAPFTKDDISNLKLSVILNERLEREMDTIPGREIDEDRTQGDGIAKLSINDIKLNIKIEFSEKDTTLWPEQKTVSRPEAEKKRKELQKFITQFPKKVTICDNKNYVSLVESLLLQQGYTITYNEYKEYRDAYLRIKASK